MQIKELHFLNDLYKGEGLDNIKKTFIAFIKKLKEHCLEYMEFYFGLVSTILILLILSSWVERDVAKEILNMIISVIGNLLSICIALLAMVVIFKRTEISKYFTERKLAWPGILSALTLILACMSNFIVVIEKGDKTSSVVLIMPILLFFTTLASILRLLILLLRSTHSYMRGDLDKTNTEGERKRNNNKL